MLDLKQITSDLTVLYVEDEVSIRTQLSLMLKTLFKNVHVATNGQEGLEIYEQWHKDIDIVITDIQMPIMNGLEMSKKLKDINNEAHIIVVSAHNDLEYFSKAIEVGIDGFIIKPIHSPQFKHTIKKSIANLNMQRQNKLYQEQLEQIIDQKTKELENFYSHDRLTGCFNRQKLDEILSKNDFKSLMLINIDNLDSVNSTYGYSTGDALLKQFADFLKDIISGEDMLFRLAGDEFVIVSNNDYEREKEILAPKIIDSLASKKFSVNDFSIHLSCTIGIAKQDSNISNESALVKAHAAMKETREIGKNRYHTYVSESPYIKKQKNNINWMLKVRDALANDLIVPYYQPIIDNKTQKIKKFECLARLRDVNSIISPCYFIEPAKLAGLLPKVTESMVAKSFEYFCNKDYEFSLNITEEDLKANYLPQLLKHLSDRYELNPNKVTLEILENISASSSEAALEQLLELKEHGFKLALDDFGSEHSNFFRLQKMNVDFIKIDGSFVKNINENKNSLDICKTIVHLAKSINCEVVAEFVHSKEVFDTINSIGVEYSQGYYFGEPRADIEVFS